MPNQRLYKTRGLRGKGTAPLSRPVYVAPEPVDAYPLPPAVEAIPANQLPTSLNELRALQRRVAQAIQDEEERIAEAIRVAELEEGRQRASVSLAERLAERRRQGQVRPAEGTGLIIKSKNNFLVNPKKYRKVKN